MPSKNTKTKLRNRSKSGVVDEFETQSKKFRNGVNKMKPNHGNKRQTFHLEDRMNDEIMAKVKSSQVAERKKITFKTTKKRETWKVVNKMKPNYGNQCQNPMNDKVVVEEKSSQVEREKMTVKTTKKRETWKVVNKMKPKQINQCQNRMNDKVMAKEKSSQVNEKENMTVKAAMKKRKTLNSSCGTDIGVFEQICDNIIADNSTNTEEGNKVEEAQKIEEEEENQIILQKLVKKPATRDIRKENSSYQPKVWIRIRKDLSQISFPEKLPADTSETPVKPKQQPGPSESLATSKQPRGFKSPVNCQHPEGPSRHRVIITPVSTIRTSSSTGSSGEINGHIHSRATRSQVTSPIIVSGGNTGHINNGVNGNLIPPPSQRESEYHPGPSKSLATSKQLSGTSETSKFPVNCEEHPEVPTPVGSSSGNSFSTCSSGETTGRIKERVRRSQGNSAVTNEDEEVTGPLNDEAIQCTGQQIKSQENLTIKFDTGDVTVTDGGRIVQMKMTNESISGQAEDVNNIVKTLSQVVRDL